MSSTYTAVTQESDYDLRTLSRSDYKLQVAQGVATPGEDASFNVVYKSSSGLGNMMTVSWNAKYGLNYIVDSEMPKPGMTIFCNGNWQQCDLGQSFHLDEDGNWSPNQNNPSAEKHSLNVDSNNDTPVRVVVGIEDSNGWEWNPIWIPPKALTKDDHGTYYTPQQKVRLWFQECSRTGTVISQDGATPQQEYDMSDSPTTYFMYDSQYSQWLDPQQTEFPM